MGKLYRAWCRSCTRASCNPGVILLALAIVILGVTRGVAWGRGNAAWLAHAGHAAAATAMTAGGCLLVLWAARIVSAAIGQHTETLPEPEPQAQPVPVPAAPAPVPMATPGYHPAYTLRPAEAAEDDPVYELTGAGE